MSAAVVRDLTPEDVIALRERWLRLVDRTDGCWRWVGFIGDQGYGQFSHRVAGHMHGGPAHRWGYELFAGPIPYGHDLDHTCCVAGVCRGGPECPHRACVNPAHMEPVTPLENTARAAPNRPIPWQLRKTHCPQGHPYAGENLIPQGTRRQCRACRDARNAEQNAKAAAATRAARRARTLSFFAKIQSYTPVVCRREGGPGAQLKTHCKRGHPLVGDNLVVYDSGDRACKACRMLRKMDPEMRAEVEALGCAS